MKKLITTKEKLIDRAKKEAKAIFKSDDNLGMCDPYYAPSFQRIINALKDNGLDTTSDCEENIELAFVFHRAFSDEYRIRYAMRFAH